LPLTNWLMWAAVIAPAWLPISAAISR
jgi:hypothetical protein